MFNFLTNFWEGAQTSAVEPGRKDMLQVDNINYSETRTMNSLTLLFTALDGLVRHSFFLITHLFGPETIFKKSLLILGVVLSLAWTLI